MNRKSAPLFAVLILALVALACGGGGATDTPVPPTDTPVPATDTPVPATDTPVPATDTPVPATDTPKPSVELEPGWYHYTNGNYVNGIALDGDFLWAATSGGVIAWDLANGEVFGYTVLDGLPTNVVNDVVVCPIPDPTVIVGTDEGMALYDPATDSWERMTSDDSGMERDDVDALDCDPDLNLVLISYSFGAGFWDPIEDDWLYLSESDGLASDFVDEMLIVGDEIWVVGPFGVSVISIVDGTIIAYDEDNSDIPDENVSGVAADANGDIWLAAFDGLMKYSGGTWTIYNSDNVEEFPFLDAFERVLVGSDGTIWAGNTFGDICQFDPAAETCLAIYEGEDGMVGGLNDMIMDEDENVFYCDDGGEGISIFDGSAWYTLVLDELPASNSYYAITYTPDGTIWLGGSFGLQTFSAYDPEAGWKYNDMDGYSVYTFHLGKNGIWIGHGAGASYAEYGTDEWTNLPRADEPGEGIYKGGVLAIAEDGSGRVWFGTSDGLTVWDGDTYVHYDLLTDEERADEESPPTVYALLYDGTGVWAGTWGTLFYFDENDEITRRDEWPTGGTPYVEAFALDPDGNVLLADGWNLLKYDGTAFAKVLGADGEIQSILVDEEGALLLGLSSGGVNYYDGTELQLLTTADGLPSGYFDHQGIVLDDLGTIWFACMDGGLARYVP